MGWFSWFRKKPSEDYEQILAELSLSISTRQTRLTELALRERRAALWATIYTLAAWIVYSFVWWLRLLPRIFSERTRSNVELERVAHLAPVIIGPIAAISLRRIVQFWYHRKGAAEEATLKKLLAKQRATIEEIKQKTNYYSTRNLIERYDSKPGSVPPTPRPNDPSNQLRQRPRPSGRPEQPNIPPSTPVRSPNGAPKLQTPVTPSQMNPMTPAQFTATPPVPRQRQWYDKFADAVLGMDEGSPASLDPARSRYALICGRCSAHNGLVLESLWEDTQYVCPKCGFFNPAPRASKMRSSLSPNTQNSIRELSEERDDEPQGRLPKPDFLAPGDRHSPEPGRPRSRAESHISKASTSAEDAKEAAGDMSVMEVDD